MECDPKEVRKYFIHLEMNSSYLIRLKRLIDLGRSVKTKDRFEIDIFMRKTIRFRGSMEWLIVLIVLPVLEITALDDPSW